MITRTLTMLNEQGDTTIAWTPDQDKEMLEIIKKKMEEGVSFFIVEPQAEGLLAPQLTELKKANDAKKHRALTIKDEDLAKFVSSGAGVAVSLPESPAKGKHVRRSENAEEIASSSSVAVKPLRGG